MKSVNPVKIVIVAIYFGRLPNYFQLWLDSCGRNTSFTWLFITDCILNDYSVPPNVLVKSSDLKTIKKLFSDRLGTDIALETPYKLCDYRPIYWLLLDAYDIEGDFWGHCDIDVLFGRLRLFVTPELLDRYDRLFGLGHPSLMRSCPIPKLAFSSQSSAPSWLTIFSKSKTIGFDAHWGVNRTWDEWPLLFHEDESIAADIDPQFRSFRLTDPSMNLSRQLFYMEDGAIYQGSFNRNGEWIKREYAYIHFQKRPMPIGSGVLGAERLLIGPAGFTCLPSLPRDEAELQMLPGAMTAISYIEWKARVKTWLRYKKRGLLRVLTK